MLFRTLSYWSVPQRSARTRLRIWGLGVRLLSGAPNFSVSYETVVTNKQQANKL